jgi:hypothetical protein
MNNALLKINLLMAMGQTQTGTLPKAETFTLSLVKVEFHDVQITTTA